MSWGRFVCRGDLLQFRAHIGVQSTAKGAAAKGAAASAAARTARSRARRRS